MNTIKMLLPLFAALACVPSQARAASILDAPLSSFAVLGSSTVTNVPTSNIRGNVGVWSSGGGNAITGFTSSPVAPTTDSQVKNGGQVYAGTATAQSAQEQLGHAIANLGLMGPGTVLGANLAGLTLTPGVYSVSAGTSNLTGTLTLDGLGNANAAWVFQMASSLITSSGSLVNVINTDSNAGVFWDVRSSATLGSNSVFQGNILANSSITLDTGATIGCGSALANTGAVTMMSNAISIGCGGGISVPGGGGTPTFLSFAPISAVPEPETGSMLLAGLGMIGFLLRRNRHVRWQPESR